MRNLALSVALIAGLFLPIGAITLRAPRPSPLRARTALRSPGPNAPARAAAMAACKHGARARPVLAPRRLSLHP